ncbi:hypothetical protein [Haloplanus rubicundus]|uniref:Uncharacterized protein n=1 Tax=Haloplanus rubicundus TaxID=1547898 RepID=A0A345E852_9EURY|nr:hypothetical protein [Haloplanus rubicundus]AXG08374.1 hypothetical protein DU484_00065 [Haloplanus rubicundus]
MRDGRTLRGVRVVAVTLVVVAALVTTAAGTPTLDVRIDGQDVRDGDELVVTGDPSVRVEATANGSLRRVEILVNRSVRQSFTPDSESVMELVELDLDDGKHEISVRTVTESGEERQLTVTVTKDSTGPKILYTSPFQSSTNPGTETVDHANVTLAADLEDQSGIKRVRIRHTYEWIFAGQSEVTRDTYRIDDPGERFSQPMLLGLGENTVVVEAVDVNGQRRRHEMTIDVVDAQLPAIDIDRFEQDGGRIHVAGTVTDNVKFNSLSYRLVGTSQESFVLNPTTKEPARERLATDFEFTADVGEGETVRIVATDVAGNERVRELPFDYRGHLEPTVELEHEIATGYEGEVAFSGEVSDSRVTRVVLESVGPDGETIETLTPYEGDTRERVGFQGRIGAAPDETTLVVYVTDVRGGEHREAFRVDTTGLLTPTAASTPAPTLTPTLTSTQTATPASDGAAAMATETPTPTEEGGGSSLLSGLPGLPVLVALTVLVSVFTVGWKARAELAAVGKGVAEQAWNVGLWIGGGAAALTDWTAWVVGEARSAIGGLVGERLSGLDADRVNSSKEDDRTERRPYASLDDSDAGAAGATGPDTTEKMRSLGELVSLDPDEFDVHDAERLVEAIDADDTETVVQATECLGDLAVARPDLVSDAGAVGPVRDLRFTGNEAEQEAANRAVEKFRQAALV